MADDSFIDKSWPIVLTGIVTYFLGRWQERSAELSRRINTLTNLVEEMEDAASKYWAAPANDPHSTNLATKIKGRSLKIGTEISELNDDFWAFRFSSFEYLTRFRRAATDPPFEQADRQTDNARIGLIQRRATELQTMIRRARIKWLK